MAETTNLKLYKADPVVDGEKTFNIDKMLNENWDKIDEAVANVHLDLPDASLEQKGIVQLSSAIDGTREDIAVTELALKKVKESLGSHAADTAKHVTPAERAAWNAKMDANRPSNLLPNSTGLFGFTGWKIVNGDDGWITQRDGYDRTSYFAFFGPTGSSYRYIESDPIPVATGQKYTFSVEFYSVGLAMGDMYLEIVNADYSKIYEERGFCDGNSSWHRKYVTITADSSGAARVRLVLKPDITQDLKLFARATAHWGEAPQPWNNDADPVLLFQSGVNAKAGIVDAINAMGGSASTNDGWATMASKIQTLSKSGIINVSFTKEYTTGNVLSGITDVEILRMPSMLKFVSFTGNLMIIGYQPPTSGSITSASMILKDINGAVATIVSNSSRMDIMGFQLDMINNLKTGWKEDPYNVGRIVEFGGTLDMPTNFDLKNPITLAFRTSVNPNALPTERSAYLSIDGHLYYG